MTQPGCDWPNLGVTCSQEHICSLYLACILCPEGALFLFTCVRVSSIPAHWRLPSLAPLSWACASSECINNACFSTFVGPNACVEERVWILVRLCMQTLGAGVAHACGGPSLVSEPSSIVPPYPLRQDPTINPQGWLMVCFSTQHSPGISHLYLPWLDHHTPWAFIRVSGDLNFAPHTCTARSLTARPSPQLHQSEPMQTSVHPKSPGPVTHCVLCGTYHSHVLIAFAPW